MNTPMNNQQHQAVMRLQHSRLALASAAGATEQGEPLGANDGHHNSNGLADLLNHPMVVLAGQAFKQMALGHPLIASAALLGDGVKQGATRTIRRHPLLSIAAGLAVGALLVHQRRRALALVGLYALPSLRSAIGQALSMLLSRRTKP
jgi:hypothetical protein